MFWSRLQGSTHLWLRSPVLRRSTGILLVLDAAAIQKPEEAAYPGRQWRRLVLGASLLLRHKSRDVRV